MALKIMGLTDAAVERINEIIEDSDKPVIGVRVGVKNAGCAAGASAVCSASRFRSKRIADRMLASYSRAIAGNVPTTVTGVGV